MLRFKWSFVSLLAAVVLTACPADPRRGGAVTDTGTDGGSMDATQDINVPDSSGMDVGTQDTNPPPTDTGTPDTNPPDTGTPDTGMPDTGTPDTGTPDTGTPDTGTPDTGTPDTGMDTGTPDTGMDTGTPDPASCNYDTMGGLMGTTCFPRCRTETATAIDACTDGDCVRMELNDDTSPPGTVRVDGTDGSFGCSGCYNLQVNSCIATSCPTQTAAWFDCLDANCSGSSDPNCGSTMCSSQDTALDTCVTSNMTVVQNCAGPRAQMCFGAVSEPGCSASFERGITGDACRPFCATSTLEAVGMCPDDNTATPDNEFLACRDAALAADGTAPLSVEGFMNPLDCEGCVSAATTLCWGNICPAQYDALFTCRDTNCAGSADIATCLNTSCSSELAGFDSCLMTNETEMDDCFASRIEVCFP